MKVRLLWFIGMLAGSFQCWTSQPEALTASTLKELTFNQRLNSQLSLGLGFVDDAKRSVTVEDCLSGRPSILIFGYYECPMLCNLVLNGVVESLQEIAPGADNGVRVIFVSIDPGETPELALAKKKNYLKRLARPGSEERWRFLCGEEPEIQKLASEAGFSYKYDPVHRQYAHPSGIMILTPEGRISRYFFGVSFPAADLKVALSNASSNQTGSLVQSVIILCSRFVPLTGKFSWLIMAAVRVVAIATILGIIGIALLSRRIDTGPAEANERTEAR